MKKVISVLSVALVTVQLQAVTAIFRWRFAPNTSNGYVQSVYFNNQLVPLPYGPQTIPDGSVVITVNYSVAGCSASEDNNPVAFEYEEYSTDGGATWTIMPETWHAWNMPDFSIQAYQIDTLNGGAIDEGPITNEHSCSLGG